MPLDESGLPRSTIGRVRRPPLVTAVAVFALAGALSSPALAQERPFWDQNDTYGDSRRQAQAPAGRAGTRRDDSYRPPENYNGPPGGFGSQAAPGTGPYDSRPGYAAPATPGGYSGSPSYDPRYQQPAPTYSAAPPPAQPGYVDPRYGGQQQVETFRDRSPPSPRGDDAYRPPAPPQQYGDNRTWNEPQSGYGPPPGGDRGYGQPYSPPPEPGYGQGPAPGESYGNNEQPRWDERRAPATYSQNEVVDTGHRFFGSISQGLARAVERVFRSQGRPNGYILGEDAGGAFVAGLRYGEGTMFTKDVGTHRVFWQGPSLGYDFGGEGSKTMVLVYNLRDPSDIYSRFGGVQGAAYVIGGVSVQFQTHEHVTLAVIRSGVGLRLGANVGYLKYTRSPTWNPF